MLLRSAMAKNGFQPERPCGRRIRYTHNTGSRIIAASATRSKTTVSGGNSFSTTPLKKNDPPHSTESTASRDQSRASIRSSLAVIAAHIIASGQPLTRNTGTMATRFPRMRKAMHRLLRPRHDLDHFSFVVIGRIGLRPVIGLHRGASHQGNLG